MVANPNFYTGNGATPPVITPPAVPPSAPVTVTAPYAVGNGQILYFQGNAVIQTGNAPITNAGLIAAIPNTPGAAFGISESSENFTIHDFVNAKSGVLSVEANGAGNDAYGYDLGCNPVAIENQGVIQAVSLSGDAYGAWDYGCYSGATFDNARTGLVAVWAAGTGYGLFYYQTGVALTNEGLIEVTAARAVGVYGAWSLSNSGSIIATDIANDGGSIGVKIGFASIYNGTKPITNSGLIKADKAVFFDANELSPALSQSIVIDNSGRIYGEIDLSENAGADTISNTGTIIGSIDCTKSSNAQLTNSGLVRLKGGTSQLTTVDNSGTIGGSGALNVEGAGAAFTNRTLGLVESNGALTITTSAGQMQNDGVIEANGGVLDITNAVKGTGRGVIAKGTLRLGSTFTENVTFTGTTGVLDLAQSQSYTGTISGFSHSGGTKLDLRDVSFVSPTEATFSGNATGGTLTVTDGTHTAKIALFGNYLASTFVAQSDGHGGTIVRDPPISSAVSLVIPAGH